MNFIFNIDLAILIKTIGYFGIFFIIFAESGLFFGFFLPGDTLLFTAGLLASQSYFNIIVLILIITFAATFGDQIGYFFGKKIGPKIFNRDESFYFKKKHIINTENFYKKHGKKTIILARFIPIIRTFVPILAGIGNMNYKTFVTYNIIGGLFWGAGITSAGYLLGEKIPNIDKYLIPILFLIIFIPMLPTIFSLIYKKIIKNKK